MKIIPPDTAAGSAAAALSWVASRQTVPALHAILTRGSHIPAPCLTLVRARDEIV